MSQREELIQSLSDQLTPVKPVASIERMALTWLILSVIFVVAMTAYFGPIRPDAFRQLFSVPRFFVEMVSGLLAIVLLGLCAFRAAVPGRLTRRFGLITFAVLSFWLLQYLVGLLEPALAPSMAGKREECWLETLCFSIPPMLLAFVLTRRLFPLRPLQSALGFSLAAGLLPAWYMQMACMYVIPHILEFHILPGLVVAACGLGLARFYRR